MMKRKHVAEYYTAYLDGSLPEPLRQHVEQHLHDCATCSAELSDLRALLLVIRSLPAEIPLPHGFAQRVRARLPERASRRWLGWLTPAISAGALAAVSLLLLLGYSLRPVTHVLPTLKVPAPVLTATAPVQPLPHALAPHIDTVQSQHADHPSPLAHRHQSSPQINPHNAHSGTSQIELALLPPSVRDAEGYQSRHDAQASMLDGTALDALLANSAHTAGTSNDAPGAMAPTISSPTQTCSIAAPAGTASGADDATPMRPAAAPGSVRAGMGRSMTSPNALKFTGSPGNEPSSMSLIHNNAQLAGGNAVPKDPRVQLQAPLNFSCAAANGMMRTDIIAQKLTVQHSPFADEQHDVLRHIQPIMNGSLDVAVPRATVACPTAVNVGQQVVNLRITGRAHAAMTFRYMIPPSADATQITLSTHVSEVALRLPTLPQGSVVRFSLTRAHQYESFYLFTPGKTNQTSTVMLHISSDLMRAAIAPLASAVNAVVFCPADLAERHITFTADGLAPNIAWQALATQEHLKLEEHGQLINISPEGK